MIFRVSRKLRFIFNNMITLFSFMLYQIGGSKKSEKTRLIKLKEFIFEQKVGNCSFRFSDSVNIENLYSSSYACMAISILNSDDNLLISADDWKYYFDNFQNEDDGLFYDKNIINDSFHDSDMWGARHLALHMCGAYNSINLKPKHEFLFIKKYYSRQEIVNLIESQNWESYDLYEGDFDNKIMNIGTILQYQRDFFCDQNAEKAIQTLKKELKNKINPKTGIWGPYISGDTPRIRSRAIQFAYHLMPIFFYDSDLDEFDFNRIIKICLKTQNILGGYGVKLNSSACEDIDSIDILIRSYEHVHDDLKFKISESIDKALKWILFNQSKDGGFFFRFNEEMQHGHENLTSKKNRGEMFSSWFRLLSIAYIYRFTKKDLGLLLKNTNPYEF